MKDNLDELEDDFKIPKLASGGIIENPIKNPLFIAKEVGGISLIPKTITKKRFIKLLMGEGIQRNDAIKMHEMYMKEHSMRTKLGFAINLDIYKVGKLGKEKI